METFFFEISLAIMLFAGTNLDDIFVLLTFFTDKRFKVKEVFVGQFLGILSLFLGSFALSFGAKQIPLSYIGLLGFVPLIMGIKKLWEMFGPTEAEAEDVLDVKASTYFAKILSVTAVTIANGGDNLSVYVPLFATKSIATLTVYLIIFLIMTFVWCFSAIYLVNHRRIGTLLKKHGTKLIPLIFITLGIYILMEADILSLINI